MSIDNDSKNDLTKLLQSGKVSEFNKKRQDDRYQTRDFKGIKLIGLHLRYGDLTVADLRDADLGGVNTCA